MNDYITKPFKAQTLFSKLQKWINPEKQIQITSSEAPLFSIDRKSLVDTHKISDIKGIQLDKALLRLNGNKRLLAKILANFYEMAQHASIDIHAALSKKETKTAVRIVHSLKGAAGNISAPQLQAAAQELENTIEKDDDSLQTALNHFDKVLHQVLKSAARLLQLLPIEPQDFDNPEYSKDALLPLDVSNPAKISTIITKLSRFISENDPIGAENCILAIKTEFKDLARHKHMQCVFECLDNFDFDSARQELKRIAENFGIALNSA